MGINNKSASLKPLFQSFSHREEVSCLNDHIVIQIAALADPLTVTAASSFTSARMAAELGQRTINRCNLVNIRTIRIG
jgi:hypothetical protein